MSCPTGQSLQCVPTCPTGQVLQCAANTLTSQTTTTTTQTRTCPPGQVLQSNGICGTNAATITQTSNLYCGPQYLTKNCAYMAQLTTALTPATGSESIPNTICAYLQDGTQYACDPGCCTGTPATSTSPKSSMSLSWWIIILIIVGVSLFMLLLLYFATRKKNSSVNTRNGPTSVVQPV